MREDLRDKSDHDLLIITAANTEDMKNDIHQIWRQFSLLNGRVRSLENWRAYIAGGLGVVGLVLAIVVKVLIG